MNNFNFVVLICCHFSASGNVRRKLADQEAKKVKRSSAEKKPENLPEYYLKVAEMSSSSPCAACKLQRRKCGQKCIFAPYFPPDNPQKFANIHKVFGASNVSKLLSELSAHQREDAVNSLAYEAEYRLREPIYGCVGLISVLKHKLNQVQIDLENAKKELATYIGPSALLPLFNHAGYIPAPSVYASVALNPFAMRDSHQQYREAVECQQGSAVDGKHEPPEMMMRSYEHQPHESVMFNSGYEASVTDESSCRGFNLLAASSLPPALALGCNSESSYQAKQPERQYQVLQPQPFLLHSHTQGSAGRNLDDGAGTLSC